MYNLGVDLGGSKMAAGIVDTMGNIIIKESIPTRHEKGAGTVMDDLSQLCINILKKSDIDFDSIISLGVGSPGIINSNQGIIEYTSNLNMTNVNVKEMLSNVIPVPVYLDNDANCAALGENFAGAAKGCKSSVTITLGTGIGGGIIINDKIVNGAFGSSGEIGHHVIVVGGELCTCGRLGCWESYSSATAIIKAGKKALGNKSGKIYELVYGDANKIEAKTVFDAYDAGDADAIQIIENYYLYLAEGITNIINILQPAAIVIGGGISARGDKLIEPVKKLVEQSAYGANEFKVKIVKAELGNDAGIIGAAMLGRSNML